MWCLGVSVVLGCGLDSSDTRPVLRGKLGYAEFSVECSGCDDSQSSPSRFARGSSFTFSVQTPDNFPFHESGVYLDVHEGEVSPGAEDERKPLLTISDHDTRYLVDYTSISLHQIDGLRLQADDDAFRPCHRHLRSPPAALHTASRPPGAGRVRQRCGRRRARGRRYRAGRGRGQAGQPGQAARDGHAAVRASDDGSQRNDEILVPVLLTEQLERRGGKLIGLGQHRCARLRHDLMASQCRGFASDIDVADARVCGGEVLLLDPEVRDRHLEAVLRRAHARSTRREGRDGGVNRAQSSLSAAARRPWGG